MTSFKRVFFTVMTGLLLLPAARAEQPAFLSGEKIYYSVKQLGIKAGDAVLEFRGDDYIDGQKYTLVIFTAKGFNFYDEERIYLDPVSLTPVKVLRDLNIFGNKENIMEEYATANGAVRVTKTAAGKTTVADIMPPVYAAKASPGRQVDNIYGFLYRARLGQQIRVGSAFDLHLPTLDLTLSGLKRVDFNAAGKQYKAVMVQSVPAKYTIWFDEGPKKLPLRIAGALGMANTVMVMTGYEDK